MGGGGKDRAPICTWHVNLRDRDTHDHHDSEGSVCECEQPYSDYRDGQISPALAAQRETYLPVLYPWTRERDRERGQPGQNQSHGVPEEGQVSGKQIPVQLRRRSPGAQHQLLLPGHPDLCIGEASVWL